MEELFMAIMGALMAIASAFLELLIHLLAIVFGSSFLAHHAKGMKRFFFAVCAFSALHLFLGLVLPFFSNSGEYLLSALFNRWVMLGSLIVLILAFASTQAIEFSSRPAKDSDADPSEEPETPPKAPVFLIYATAAILVFGLFSMVSADRERTSLREKLCISVTGKINPLWKDRGERAIELTGKLLGRDVKDHIPCQNDDKSLGR